MNASTTIGLYDFLNMVVMGFLLLFPVVTFPTDAVFLIWLIPCFIVGLIYHKLMENTLGICMRNKDCMILKAYESVNGKENEKDSSKENYYIAYYFLMEKRLLGSIPILEAQAAFLRNILPILFVYGILSLVGVYCPIKIELTNDFFCITLMLFLAILCIVFLIYFFDWNLQLCDICMSCLAVGLLILISIFVAILLFPYNFSTTSLAGNDTLLNTRKFIALTMLVFVIIIPFLWYKTQMKIHELVWEGKKYLEQEIEQKKQEGQAKQECKMNPNENNQIKIINNNNIYNNGSKTT